MTLSSRLTAAGFAILLSLPAAAQQPAPAQPQFKGIWEPVSFPEDIDLRSVFFVTADVGWAAGEKGTLIHTKDGGATWTAQLGGDPQAAEKEIKLLTFFDERTGWAVQDGRILRTTDGENWQDLGSGLPDIKLLAMISATEGVAEASPGIGVNPSTLYRTRDGGKTWKPVAPCRVKAQMQGLTQEIRCEIARIQFVSPTQGWVVAHRMCAGSCDPPPIFGKTEDGGETWTFFVRGEDPEVWGNADFFFTGESNGVVLLTSFPKGRLARTTDGGQTWTGLIATVNYNAKIRFADPQVGWVLERGKLTYTTDGGARWNSRAIQFPADYHDFSFPRRDRAYVVGRHGMVFRYRVVPAAEPAKAGALATAAMPGFESPLDDQAAEAAAVLAELSTAVKQLPEGAAAAATNPPTGATPATGAPPSPEAVAAEASSALIAGCCGKSVNKLNVVITAIAKSLPSFLAQFKNTNLFAAGLRMLTDLPGKFGDLRSALLAFKHAGDKDAAEAALASIGSAAQSLHQSAKVAFQQELPPPGEAQPEGPSLGVSSTPPVIRAGADSARGVADSAAVALKKAAEAKAKQAVGGLIKKKIPVPRTGDGS